VKADDNLLQSPTVDLTVLRGRCKLTCQTPDIDISPDKIVQITGKLSLPVKASK
jgi:hypothetical protein